jgi:hypothetical protein
MIEVGLHQSVPSKSLEWLHLLTMIHPQNSLIGHSDSAEPVCVNTQKWGWALVDPFPDAGTLMWKQGASFEGVLLGTSNGSGYEE